MRRVGFVLALVAAILLAGALAGCTRRADGDAPASATPDVPGDAEAQAILARAARELPAVFSVAMNATTTLGQTLTFTGTFDNETERTYLDLRGEPRLMERLAAIGGAGTYLAGGLSIYVTPVAAAYVANGSAFVYVDDPETESMGSLLPNPASSPIGALMRGDEIIRGYGGEDIRVTNVTDTTWEGQPAKEMVAKSVRPDTRFRLAKLTVVGEPPRIVHVRATLNGTNAADPLANATLEGDLYYDDARRIEAPEHVHRAIALAYLPKRSPLDPRNATWTFVSDGGVKLDEVHVLVKVPNATAGVDPGNLETAWTFPLSSRTSTQGNMTLTFTDADGDQQVSAGDTLRASVTEGTLPPYVLSDLVSGLRVLPMGASLLLAATLALALALRRRSF